TGATHSGGLKHQSFAMSAMMPRSAHFLRPMRPTAWRAWSVVRSKHSAAGSWLDATCARPLVRISQATPFSTNPATPAINGWFLPNSSTRGAIWRSFESGALPAFASTVSQFSVWVPAPTLKPLFRESSTRRRLEIFFERNRLLFVRKCDVGLDCHGAYFDVCATSPALCVFRRDRRSAVTPT